MNDGTQILYASSYGSADEQGIKAYRFYAGSGKLTELGSASGVESPAYVALHPNGRWLYAASEISGKEGEPGGLVWALAVSGDGATFELINSRPSGGDFPCHLAIDATGRWLATSNYGTGSIGVLPILRDGSLGEMSDTVQHEGAGPNRERQERAHAHSSNFAPDNRFLLVADLGMDAVMVYRFDAEHGKLTLHQRVSTRPGAGPRHMAWHPASSKLYVANELASTVALYDYDVASGRLTEKQVLSTIPEGAPENLVADIHLNPEGNRLYVSNRGHDSIAIFAVGEDGTLERLGLFPCGGEWPRMFALAPGGLFMSVANEHSGRLSILPLQGDVPREPVSSATLVRVSCVQFAV